MQDNHISINLFMQSKLIKLHDMIVGLMQDIGGGRPTIYFYVIYVCDEVHLDRQFVKQPDNLCGRCATGAKQIELCALKTLWSPG